MWQEKLCVSDNGSIVDFSFGRCSNGVIGIAVHHRANGYTGCAKVDSVEIDAEGYTVTIGTCQYRYTLLESA